MTGLEFIRMMQERGCQGESFRKFIMSGDTTSINMSEVKMVGCNVLQKPVRLKEIDRIIKEIAKITPTDRILNDLDGRLKEIA